MKRIEKTHADFDAACPHGFRASFNAWADENGYEFEVSQGTLGHSIGTSTTKAHSRREVRRDHLTRRVPMMQAWGEYVCGRAKAKSTPANVLEFERAA